MQAKCLEEVWAADSLPCLYYATNGICCRRSRNRVATIAVDIGKGYKQDRCHSESGISNLMYPRTLFTSEYCIPVPYSLVNNVCK